jgi:hypothetical protein
MSETAWTPKPGEEVRVVRNRVHAHRAGRPVGYLRPGDIIKCQSVGESGHTAYNDDGTRAGWFQGLMLMYLIDDGFTNRIPVEDVEPLLSSAQRVADALAACLCSCDMTTIMRDGCQCGGK